MRRRDFILIFATMIFGSAEGQERTRRLGVLIASVMSKEVLERVLISRGWKLGGNLQIDYRITGGDTDLTERYARELLAMHPDAPFATTNTSMAALHAEHSNVPTVFAMVSDPVGMHYVQSFSRPGGNVTGFTPFEPSLAGKWVSLLKEVAPVIEHIGLVYNPEPGNNSAAFYQAIKEATNGLGISSIETPSGEPADIDRMVLALKEKPRSGLIFLPDALTSVQSHHFTTLVAEARLPAIYPLRLYCAAGGLMSYGVNIRSIYEGAASYVDQLLRGTSPAELPVQAPTEFELILNRTAAKQLGLELPPTLTAHADEIID
jgi:putative ABC transport system substrate-binding protein